MPNWARMFSNPVDFSSSMASINSAVCFLGMTTKSRAPTKAPNPAAKTMDPAWALKAHPTFCLQSLDSAADNSPLRNRQRVEFFIGKDYGNRLIIPKVTVANVPIVTARPDHSAKVIFLRCSISFAGTTTSHPGETKG